MDCMTYPELWRGSACTRLGNQDLGPRDFTSLSLSPAEFDAPLGFSFQPGQYVKEKEKNPQEVADALLSLKHAIVHPQMSPLQQATQSYYQPATHYGNPAYSDHDVHGSSLFSVNVSMSMNVGVPQAGHSVHQPPWSPHQHQPYETAYYTAPQGPDDGYFYGSLNSAPYAREPYYFSPDVHSKNDHYVSDLSKYYSRNHPVTKGIKFLHGARGTNHSNMAELSKLNICRICGKNYARPSTLKTHMRTHSGEKPYRCSSCNKSFSQAANLTAHLRTHSGEKPFTCPVCDRRFSQSSSVTTHMRTHSGERPYRCRMCKKAFSDSSTLTKHLRIHSGEKPYQCKLCLLRFSQSGNLNRHMRVHAN